MITRITLAFILTVALFATLPAHAAAPLTVSLTVDGVAVDPHGGAQVNPAQTAVATWTLDPGLMPGPWSCTYDAGLLRVTSVQPAPQMTATGFITAPAQSLRVEFTAQARSVQQTAVLACTVETPQGRQYEYVRVTVMPPVATSLPPRGGCCTVRLPVGE